MPTFYKDIAYPQIALFVVLVIIVIWLLSDNILFGALAGGVVFFLGYKGYLEKIGIGTDSSVKRCVDYLIDNEKVAGTSGFSADQLSTAATHLNPPPSYTPA